MRLLGLEKVRAGFVSDELLYMKENLNLSAYVVYVKMSEVSADSG